MTNGSLAPRSDFPILDEVVYLNQAAIGLVPAPTAERMRAFERDVALNGTFSFDDEVEAAVFDAAREQAARLIGADVEDVAVVTSATEALCQLAWWRRPGAGSNVVSADIEFPSVTYPWLRVAEETGAEVRLVNALEDPAGFALDRIADLVDDRTDAICISHVQYATGHRLDLKQLHELARRHDALLIVDATQSAGVVPIDVSNPPVDVVLSSAYKWLSGPTGAAFCYMRPELRERFRPPFVGWRGTPDPPRFDARAVSLHAGMRRMEYSTVSYAAGLGLGDSAAYLIDIGIERILRHSLALSGRLATQLEGLGAEIVTPRADGERAGIVAARFPGRPADRMCARLGCQGVHAGARLGAVRFSLHAYNTGEDVDRAVAAVASALEP